MRVYAYIDGFNFYYGALKDTPYKWLDLKAMLVQLLPSHFKIERIKYFTARVNGKVDPDAPRRQQAYLKALETCIPEIKIYYGHFMTHRVPMPHARTKKKVTVLKTEEKGSDVNLAVHILNDGWLGRYDCAVVVSNDSDLAESLKIVSKHLGKAVGVVQISPKWRVSRQLQKHSTFVYRIRKGVLAASQLPNPVPGTKIIKPPVW